MEAKGLSHFPFFPIVNIDSLLNVIQYISYTNAFYFALEKYLGIIFTNKISNSSIYIFK